MGTPAPITATEFFTFILQLILPFVAGYLAARGLCQWNFIAKYTIGFVVTMLLAPILLIVILMFLPTDSGVWVWLGEKTSGALSSAFDGFIFLIQKAGLIAVAAIVGMIMGFKRGAKP